MKILLKTVKKTLNKAYYKQSIKRNDIELLKENLEKLYSRFDDTESEEHLKNILSDFLKETWYSSRFEINTKDRIDLAIHNGKSSKDTVGVIIEVKRPQSPERMTEGNLNCKALHELILYYFDERNGNKNIEVKHLITTNINEWFIFDENDFDKVFFRNSKLQKLYKTKIDQSKDNPFFYSEAQKIIAELDDEICCTHFDLKKFEKIASNEDSKSDNPLIELFKIFSPEHLLKLTFQNDSNSLNKEFYSELLHIIGLEESKDGSKKLITRKKLENRNDGSLLENTINILRVEECTSKIPNASQFGDTQEERLFSVGLELCITWLNRILFLKLLEGQLISYHRDDRKYSFLNSNIIQDFDELNELFFEVLAVKTNERTQSVNKKFGNIPYLNSSLFEKSDLENYTIRINSLKGRLEIPIYKSTVIKDGKGNRLSGNRPALHYLFDFLDAYDFATENTAKIQEQNKSIINASVLGLIFEKINGYKDGSFFTPGFITMYMCRETLRRAVVQKFNEHYSWDIQEFNDLKDKVDGTNKTERHDANEIINSIKVCDPAVGSGHFLVSALNEIIAIKSEIGVLQYRDGSRIKGNRLTIENDELIIIDEETDQLFEYRLNQNQKPISDLQVLQETIFHEKETIIENCLFGVDINPKSVLICRLRLWIELLKNAYYTEESNYLELETLPNIDINIKIGNSLISRFPLDTDLKKALKKNNLTIDDYRNAVQTYRNANSKVEKHEMERLIESIKNDFESEIARNDKRLVRLAKLKGELTSLTSQTTLYERTKKEKDDWTKQINTLTGYIQKLESELEEIKTNAIYQNAFEWRFEFPEVLDDEGLFVGFDVMIGNPPYLSSKEFHKNLTLYLNQNYLTSQYQLDLYIAFIELSIKLTKHTYLISLITPNSWLKNMTFSNCRKFLLDSVDFQNFIINMDNVFEEASVDTLIFVAKKSQSISSFKIHKFENQTPIFKHSINQQRFLLNERYVFDLEMNDTLSVIINKIRANSIHLESIAEITRGVNPYDKYTGQSEEIIRNKVYHASFKKDNSFLPEIRGKHVFNYYYKWDNQHFISYGPWLAAPRELKFFQGQRLIMRQVISDKLNCTLISEDFIIDQSVFIAKPFNDNAQYINAIQGILASKLIATYFKYTSNEFDALFPKIKIGEFRTLPIFKDLQKANDLLSLQVSNLLAIKKSNPEYDTNNLENQLDQLVFRLYGLSEEEIAVIEEKN